MFSFFQSRNKQQRATQAAEQTRTSFLISRTFPTHTQKTTPPPLHQKSSWVSAKLTYGFITRAYAKDPALCRLMFFSDELDEGEVERFVQLLRENDGETPVLDVRELPKQVPLPSPLALSGDGATSSSSPLWPAFVLGGREDTIVDEQACLESAKWLGFDPSFSSNDGEEKASRRQQQQLMMIDKLAHDCMLDARWREAADALLGWAEGV